MGQATWLAPGGSQNPMVRDDPQGWKPLHYPGVMPTTHGFFRVMQFREW